MPETASVPQADPERLTIIVKRYILLSLGLAFLLLALLHADFYGTRPAAAGVSPLALNKTVSTQHIAPTEVLTYTLTINWRSYARKKQSA